MYTEGVASLSGCRSINLSFTGFSMHFAVPLLSLCLIQFRALAVPDIVPDDTHLIATGSLVDVSKSAYGLNDVPQPTHGLDVSQGAYGINDLLVAIPIHWKAAVIIESSRVWRQGAPTHFVIDEGLELDRLQQQGQSYNETFFELPDFPSIPSTMRQVLTPLLAYHNHPTNHSGFKWLLLGDADTIFSIPAVLRMLNEYGLPAEEPHVLNDFILEREACPRGPTFCNVMAMPLADPRCLPCPGGRSTCPCRLPEGCYKPVFDPKRCGAHVVGYGGAGIIFSIGMLREMVGDSSAFIRAAFTRVTAKDRYSDAALAEILRSMGYGFTQPPRLNASSSSSPTGRRFGTYCSLNDGRSPRAQLKDLTDRLKDDPRALENTVSIHVRGPGRKFNFVRDVLPVYKQIASLIANSQQQVGTSQQLVAAPPQPTTAQQAPSPTAADADDEE